MTKSEFETAIRIFLREMSPVVLASPPDAFAHTELRREIREARRMFQDATTVDSTLVGIAVGLVDEFVTSEWERVIDQAYDAYSSDST
jgi:hypothetical protein